MEDRLYNFPLAPRTSPAQNKTQPTGPLGLFKRWRLAKNGESEPQDSLDASIRLNAPAPERKLLILPRYPDPAPGHHSSKFPYAPQFFARFPHLTLCRNGLQSYVVILMTYEFAILF